MQDLQEERNGIGTKKGGRVNKVESRQTNREGNMDGNYVPEEGTGMGTRRIGMEI